PADHQAAGQEEEQAHEVELEPQDADRRHSLLVKRRQQDPQRNDAARDRRALEVTHLLTLRGERLGGDVVPGETAHAAADEVQEDELVDAALQTGRKRDPGRSHAEGNHVGEGIELPAHRRGLVAPARHAAVEQVENRRYGNEKGGDVHAPALLGSEEGHGLEQGSDAAESVGDGEEVRQVEVSDHREVPRSHPTGVYTADASPSLAARDRAAWTWTGNWLRRARSLDEPSAHKRQFNI